MSMEYWLKGRLELDEKGRKAAETELEEEGCADSDENLLGEEQLVWAGDVLTVDERGSSPYDSFDTSSMVLSIYARHATSGEMFAINIEDGTGDRFPAGADSIELEDEEVDRLRAEYGWKTG